MKWKVVIGIILIALSVGGIYLWETKFREEITMTEVLAASRDITQNKKITQDDLMLLRVNPEALIDGALTAEDAQSLYGKLAAVPIYAKQQITEKNFISEEDLVPEGYRHFVIPSDWIYSKSVTLCERDKVKIYALPDEGDEITTAASLNSVSETDFPVEEAYALGPENYYLGTFRIAVLNPENDLEIFATIDDYFKLYETYHFIGKKLVLVGEDE